MILKNTSQIDIHLINFIKVIIVKLTEINKIILYMKHTEKETCLLGIYLIPFAQRTHRNFQYT
jgi:hypothetical protein